MTPITVSSQYLRLSDVEKYNGKPLPPGYTRIRHGVIESGDMAGGEGGTWIDLPDRYIGGGVGMFTCVIRKIKVDRKRRKKV